METCKSIPFLDNQVYCYGPVMLSYYDKLFLVVLGCALVAVLVTYLVEKCK